MFNIVTNAPKPLGKYLEKFKHLFSRKLFVSFTMYTTALLLEHSRFSIQEAWNKIPDVTYRRLYYFLSKSKWSTKELNNTRVGLIESMPTTRSTHDGVCAIDDSNCHKKWAFKTEGAMPQWSTTEKGIIRGNVGVTSAFCSRVKHFPINHVPYKVSDEFTEETKHLFKSKIQIAMELIDDVICKGIAFSDFVFDTWYAAGELINHIEDLGRTWITEADVDRKISFRGKWVRADELEKLIPSDRFRAVTVPNSAGEDKTFWVYSFTAKVRGLSGDKRIVVAVGRWNDKDPKNVHVFFTNHTSLSGEQIIMKFALRWGIECIYRELKDSFYFDHFQVRRMFRIDRHWHLSMLAYTFIYWAKMNGYFSRLSPDKLQTLNEFKSIFHGLNSIQSLQWTQSNIDKFTAYSRENRRKVQ